MNGDKELVIGHINLCLQNGIAPTSVIGVNLTDKECREIASHTPISYFRVKSMVNSKPELWSNA